MSTHSNHSDSTYPEDGVSHYPQGKGTKRANSKGPLHNVAKHLNAKTRALRKAMSENGGRHGGRVERDHDDFVSSMKKKYPNYRPTKD